MTQATLTCFRIGFALIGIRVKAAIWSGSGQRPRGEIVRDVHILVDTGDVRLQMLANSGELASTDTDHTELVDLGGCYVRGTPCPKEDAPNLA